MEKYLTYKDILEYFKLHNIKYQSFTLPDLYIILYNNEVFSTTTKDLEAVSNRHPKCYPSLLITYTTRKLYKYIKTKRQEKTTKLWERYSTGISSIPTGTGKSINLTKERTKGIVIGITYKKQLENYEKQCKEILKYYNTNLLKEIVDFANKDKVKKEKEDLYFKMYNGDGNLTKNATIQASKASMQHSIYEYLNKILYTEDNENISKILDTTLLDELVNYAKNPFPINELKQQLNKVNMKNTIEKLKKLRDENPALADAIEKEFPEIIDNTPYVYSGALFMKKQYDSNIYDVVFKDNRFSIKNIKDNKFWQGIQEASNPINDNNRRYLTKRDFIKLLSKSSMSPDYIAFLEKEDLQNLHTSLFK